MVNNLNNRSSKIWILFIDLGFIVLSYLLAFQLRFETIQSRNWDSYLDVLPWVLLISLFFFSVYELNVFSGKSIWDIYSSIFVATTFIMFFTMAASFLFRAFALPRTVIIISYLLGIVFLVSWRFLFFKIFQHGKPTKILVISEIENAEQVMQQFNHPFPKKSTTYTISPKKPLAYLYSQIPKFDYIIIGRSCNEEKKSKLILHSIEKRKLVYVVPSLYDLLLSKSMITSVDDSMVMGVKPFGLSIDQQIFKRVFDLGVSFVSLTILAPLFIVVSILIKLDDPAGSIFYTQKRVGKGNKEFTIYKFRSMIENAEKLTGPTLANQNDNRITKIGRFLRHTRIDELPQLINVLKGEMSIVGPRPERKFFINQFTKEHDSYHYRTTVKPGITGYAQIMGKYTTDVENKLRYDLYYIRNYSFWLDLIILMRTVIVVLDRSKAEGKEAEASNVKSVQKKRITLNL